MPRRVAVETLVRVERDGAWADPCVQSLSDRAGLSPRDRALAVELVYGVLRNHLALDHQMERFAKRPLKRLPRHLHWNLRVAAYQLLELRVPSYAAINEALELVERGHRALRPVANAVLRQLASAGATPIDDLATRVSHPPSMLAEMAALTNVMEWAEANNRRPPVWLRRNRLRAEPIPDTVPGPLPDMLRRSNPVGDPSTWPGFAEGLFSVQDAAAQLVTHLLDPQPGERILDLCAGPGGKSAHIAERIGDRGEVCAVEPHPGRALRIEATARRLRLESIRVLVQDGREVTGTFDRVLVDAPCSGWGTLRRNPEIRLRTPSPDLPDLQRALLHAGAARLRQGGILVYAVCTNRPSEGRNHDVALDPWPIPGPLLPYASNGALETWPHLHDMDGFVARAWQKP
jgi:16S rRNA (cytosine967-C5)-methyltransferase